LKPLKNRINNMYLVKKGKIENFKSGEKIN